MVEMEVNQMEYTELDEVRVKTYGGRIGTVEKVFYEMVNGEETDNVYCYEMEIDGVHGCIVYPDDMIKLFYMERPYSNPFRCECKSHDVPPIIIMR